MKRPHAEGWSKRGFGKDWSPEPSQWNPLRVEQVEIILQLAEKARPKSILDLGCGPAAIASAILSRLSETDYVGLDVSPDSIERASETLEPFGARARLLHGEFASFQPTEPAEFDLILAIQSLHHLNQKGKRAIFESLRRWLDADGMLIVSDRFEMAGAELFDAYIAVENVARQFKGFKPFADQYSYGEYQQRHVDNFDQPDSIEFHLSAMREAGFLAECVWQNGFRGIIVASPDDS